MKTAIKALIIIVLLATAIIAGRDYFTFREKQTLYERSVLYDEELVALSKVLIEMQQLGEKYIILKNRKTKNETREALLREIEEFLRRRRRRDRITSPFTMTKRRIII